MTESLIEHTLIGIAVLLIPLGLALVLVGFRRRQHQRLVVGIGCIILSTVLWWRTSHAEFWMVDECLDAGGRYDYQAQVCQFE